MNNALINRFSAYFSRRFNRWLSKRIPSATHHTLSNKNIFIFPSAFGFSYLFFVLILFLLATNYQNNIIMLLSYVLASLFVSAMLKSFYNLSGLTIKVSTTKPSYGYSQQLIYFPLIISAASTTQTKRIDSYQRYALNLSFAAKNKNQVTITDLSTEHIAELSDHDLSVNIPFFANKRGYLSPGRLKISSEYCFGLFTTWTHLDFDFKAIAYPHPKQVTGPLSSYFSTETNEELSEDILLNKQTVNEGNDDFYELKNYKEGEPLSRIAWKQYAKGQGKLTKHYQDNQGQPCWLILANMPSTALEVKLEIMCFLILEYDRAGNDYGIDLGTIKIAPSQGSRHQQQCLIALAQYS